MTVMASQPAQITSAADSATTSPNTRYTPVSDGTDDDGPSNSNLRRPGIAPLKLQTEFAGSNADSDTDIEGSGISGISGDAYSDEDDNRGNEYDSDPDSRQNKPSRTKSLPEYTVAEERGVVRKFDRKLVPFLALLYLLSFLDRSSKFIVSSSSSSSSFCGEEHEAKCNQM